MTSPSAGQGTRKWLAYSLIAVGLVLALAVLALGIKRSRDAGGARPSGQTTATPVAAGQTGGREGGDESVTAAQSPKGSQSTPILSQNQTRPGEPNLNVPAGPPPLGIAGVYMVNFYVRADTCNQGSPSKHELEIQVEGESVRVIDRLTRVTMTGGASSDGFLVAIYSVDQEIGRRKDVINAKIEGAKITGKYFVAPPMSAVGCMIEFDLDGNRNPGG